MMLSSKKAKAALLRTFHRAFDASPAVLRRIAGPARRVGGDELDLQSQLLIRLVGWMDGKPLEQRSVAGARLALERGTMFDPPRPPLGKVFDRSLDGAAAGISARIYVPKNVEPKAPALIYFHGGGWVVGSVRTCDSVAAALAEAAGCVVVSVDYRLAPEHPFPTAADDALLAWDWVQQAAAELDIDPSRIGVGGDSAGGNLAAIVANHRRGQVKYQLLIYPGVDLAMAEPSFDLFTEDLFLTKSTAQWFRKQYAADVDDVRASPLREPDLEGVAPACVVVVGFDPLRDQCRAYAQRLHEVGALDRLIDEPSLPHGCVQLLGMVERARWVVAESARALRAGLES